ncbi:hypothetical protein OG563_47435 [Nocardia vinacea]|uniref:Uncharacterized protein n=1 Tax=Nocardia vinacea TaxID=96468 RepID=A0ABZ1YWF0_9NOCA|nr:hypothetical protein [Nocardia vinacea]
MARTQMELLASLHTEFWDSARRSADRRARERDVIAHYVESSHRHGVTSLDFDGSLARLPSADPARSAFRLYAIGYGPLQPRMQPDEICLANLERMAQAVVDLDSALKILTDAV